MGNTCLGNLECKKQILFWKGTTTAEGYLGECNGTAGWIPAPNCSSTTYLRLCSLPFYQFLFSCISITLGNICAVFSFVYSIRDSQTPLYSFFSFSYTRFYLLSQKIIWKIQSLDYTFLCFQHSCQNLCQSDIIYYLIYKFIFDA